MRAGTYLHRQDYSRPPRMPYVLNPESPAAVGLDFLFHPRWRGYVNGTGVEHSACWLGLGRHAFDPIGDNGVYGTTGQSVRADGLVGQEFDGSDDVVGFRDRDGADAPHSHLFNYTNGEVTALAWIQAPPDPGSSNTSYRIVQRRGTGGSGVSAGWQLCLQVHSNWSHSEARIGNVHVDDATDNFRIGTNDSTSAAGMAFDTLHHVGVAFAKNAGATYLDGLEADTMVRGSGSGDVGDMSTSRWPTIGCSADGTGTIASASISQVYDGPIYDVRVYNRKLSDVEIWSQYNPRTRWDLFHELGRVSYHFLTVPGGKALPHLRRTHSVPMQALLAR